MNIKNQPAFARPVGNNGLTNSGQYYSNDPSDGLTKLEWFAGMALQGILAGESEDFCGDPKANVESACDYAEAICAELEQRQKKDQVGWEACKSQALHELQNKIKAGISPQTEPSQKPDPSRSG